VKLIRKKPEASDEKKLQTQPEKQASYQPEFYDAGISAWKILVVDDEPDVHAVTKISLKNFKFDGRGIEFLNAMSGAEAQEILKTNPDIAAALIDVVMETEDAGLRLVRFIREELKNTAIRLIIRTGQPGAAPERYVIDHFDIDDYKEKTDLSTDKLYATLRTAIKSYRDISIIQRNRHGLEKILNAAPQLYRIQPVKDFFEGVLMLMIGFYGLGNDNLIFMTEKICGNSESDSKTVFYSGTGRFANQVSKDDMDNIIRRYYSEETIQDKILLIPLIIHNETRGFVYIENAQMTEETLYLIRILAAQCALALENLSLYYSLDELNKLNERKNYFIGMAAHDLRNPLGNIKLLIDMIQRSAKERLNVEETEFLSLGNKVADSALELIANLLDIVKIESGKLELELCLTDISSLIIQSIYSVSFLADPKHILIIYDPVEIPKLMLDSARMQQVIVNLLSNAIKYSHPHTIVKVSVSESDKEVILAVKDEGQGIPANDIVKLFQPFVKAKVKTTGGEQSTGLGLVICKKIVEAHGGRIWVESQVGRGTIFFVSLKSV
jgi:signal transduction histidine kinase/CheY-like chemotaxis protein